MPIRFRKQGSTRYGLRGRYIGADASKLKLIHVTSVGAAREILHSGLLTVQYCKVFRRNLNYFFVLRPAYKLRDSQEKRESIDFFPLVFVFDPKHLGPPFHVYPFDTGGAFAGAFDDAYSPWIFLEDYALEENLQGAANHIAWMSLNREEYFAGKVRLDLGESLDEWDTCGQTCVQIARLASVGNNRPDLRASSIEVAYSCNVQVDPHLKFAVLPRQFLEGRKGKNAEIVDLLSKTKAYWETYDWRPNRSPEDFHVEINKAVFDWLKKEGSL